MTAEFQSAHRYHGGTIWGILRLLAQALNDVQELRCGAGCVDNVDAGTHHFRHSEGYAVPRGIPRSGAGQCVIVIPAEPTGGFPREARE